MDKRTFLAELRARLTGLPEAEVEERLSFYAEMIEDRMEDGLTEEQAVAGVGSVEEVMAQIMSELSLTKLVKEKVVPRRALKVWEIILLVLGFPLWFTLLIAVFALALSIYIVIWAAVVCLWAADLAAAGAFVGCLVSVCVFLVQGNIWAALAILGAGLSCAGVAILLFFGSKYATKGTLALAKWALIRMKLSFVGRKVKQ